MKLGGGSLLEMNNIIGTVWKNLLSVSGNALTDDVTMKNNNTQIKIISFTTRAFGFHRLMFTSLKSYT